jgi:hypothetical protein
VRQVSSLVADQIDWDEVRASQGSPLGMLDSDPTLDHGATFCVEIDGIGSVRFTFERRGERAFIVAADLRCAD